MNARDIFLLVWLAAIAFVVGSAIQAACVEFPIRDNSTGLPVPAGMCVRGVEILDDQYPGSQIIYAHDPVKSHVYLIVDGQPIDAYWGPLPATYERLHPAYSYSTYDELLAGIAA